MLFGSWSNVVPSSCAAPLRVTPISSSSATTLTHCQRSCDRPTAAAMTTTGPTNASALKWKYQPYSRGRKNSAASTPNATTAPRPQRTSRGARRSARIRPSAISGRANSRALRVVDAEEEALGEEVRQVAAPVDERVAGREHARRRGGLLEHPLQRDYEQQKQGHDPQQLAFAAQPRDSQQRQPAAAAFETREDDRRQQRHWQRERIGERQHADEGGEQHHPAARSVAHDVPREHDRERRRHVAPRLVEVGVHAGEQLDPVHADEAHRRRGPPRPGAQQLARHQPEAERGERQQRRRQRRDDRVGLHPRDPRDGRRRRGRSAAWSATRAGRGRRPRWRRRRSGRLLCKNCAVPTARCASEPLPMTVTKPPRNIGSSAIAPIRSASTSGTAIVRHDAAPSGAERARRPGSRRQANTPSATPPASTSAERDVERHEGVGQQRELERASRRRRRAGSTAPRGGAGPRAAAAASGRSRRSRTARRRRP